MNVELHKEEKEGQNVDKVCPHYTKTGLGASGRKQVRCLAHHGYKLNQLQHCQGRLPPDWYRFTSFWYLGVHADKVVGVHDGVDKAIQQDCQIHIAIVVDVRIQPVEQKDGRVVVHVQKGQLSPFLPQHNKDGIPKVPNLGHVKQPKQTRNRWIGWVGGVARKDGIVVSVGQKEGFDRHVRAKHDL